MMSKKLGTILTILLIGLVVYLLYTGLFAKSETEETTSSANTTQQDQDATEDPAPQQEENQNRAEPTGGRYTDYHPDDLAFADEGHVVLYFSANWCPTCAILRADLDKNRANIPDDLVILKVDYDTETELKQKYGVTYQHTMVQVDSNGDLIKKWSGSYSLQEIVDEVQE